MISQLSIGLGAIVVMKPTHLTIGEPDIQKEQVAPTTQQRAAQGVLHSVGNGLQPPARVDECRRPLVNAVGGKEHQTRGRAHKIQTATTNAFRCRR
jgi:hypothetical protein